MQVWRLGAYEVVRQLGEGGMAQVYLARDVRLGREVAVKVLDSRLASRTGFKERFLREAQVAASLDHPHIVPLYDFGETDDGHLYLVMPYISGGSLQDVLRKTPLPVGDVVTYGAQMADALAYAHERGVVHRDVKPANMLLHADGRLMLSDFGLAKILTPESRARAPRNQPDAGTPEYMAPEQIEGQTDERSDIYALGVVLYLLLTGHLPFTGNSSNAVMGGHLYRLPDEPRRLNPAVTPAMQTVIMQALAKHPADRFQRASDLAAALLSALVAGDAEPLPFLLSNPTPSSPVGETGLPPTSPFAFPAPPRLTPPALSPARTPADSSGIHAFAPPPPAADGFELPQLGERVSRPPSPPSAAVHGAPTPSSASGIGAPARSLAPLSGQGGPRTPATHRLTGVHSPGAPISPAYPPGPVGAPMPMPMPMPMSGLDALGAQGPASHGLKSARRQSLVQPPAVAPVVPPVPFIPSGPSGLPLADRPAPLSLSRGASAPVAPVVPAGAPSLARVQAPAPAPSPVPGAAARRSAPPAPIPVAPASGGHGLRTAIFWIFLLLVLAALIAALVLHLSQIHTGAAVLLTGL